MLASIAPITTANTAPRPTECSIGSNTSGPSAAAMRFTDQDHVVARARARDGKQLRGIDVDRGLIERHEQVEAEARDHQQERQVADPETDRADDHAERARHQRGAPLQPIGEGRDQHSTDESAEGGDPNIEERVQEGETALDKDRAGEEWKRDRRPGVEEEQ